MLELIFQGFAEWIYSLILECWEYFLSSMLEIMSLDFSYLKSQVPVIEDMMQVLLAVGWALLLGNLVFQAIKSMLSGLGFEGEDPKLLFTRTFVFAFLLLASPQICEIGLNITSNIMQLLEVPNAVNVHLVDNSVFGSLTAAWLLVIICDVILMFKVMKLLAEIAERYVVLAMLTITAPLAFATGGSRSTSDIFTGWCRMYGSMCLLMATHIIFFKMLLSVVSAVPSGIGVFPWMILVFGITKAAKKADSIITRIGLNPALTGGGGRSLSSIVTYAVVRGAAKGVSNALGKPSGGGERRGPSDGNNPPQGGGPKTSGPTGGGKWNVHFGASGKKRAGSTSNYAYNGGDNTAYAQQADTPQPTGQKDPPKQTPGQLGQQAPMQQKPMHQSSGGRVDGKQNPVQQPPVQQPAEKQVTAGQQPTEQHNAVQTGMMQQLSGPQTAIQKGSEPPAPAQQAASRRGETPQHQESRDQVTQLSKMSQGESPSAPYTAQAVGGLPHTLAEQGSQVGFKPSQQDRKSFVPAGIQRGRSHIRAVTSPGSMEHGKPAPTPEGAKKQDGSPHKVEGTVSSTTAEKATRVSDARFTQIPVRQERAKTEKPGTAVPQSVIRSGQIPHSQQKDRETAGWRDTAAGGYQEGQLRSTQRHVTTESLRDTKAADIPARVQPGTAGTAAIGSKDTAGQPPRHGRNPVASPEQTGTTGRRSSPARQEARTVPPRAERGPVQEHSSPVQQEVAQPSIPAAPTARGTAFTYRPGTAGTAPESKQTGQQPPAAQRQSASGAATSQMTERKPRRINSDFSPKGQATRMTAPKPPREKGEAGHG